MIEVILVAKHGAENYDSQVREEMRIKNQDLKQDVIMLEQKVADLEEDRDKWRDKYYEFIERSLHDRGTGEGG
jgi:hypothetical protein